MHDENQETANKVGHQCLTYTSVMQNIKNNTNMLSESEQNEFSQSKNISTAPKAPTLAKPRYRLTPLGAQMARLPIDPKIARILLAAEKHDCMAEILVIAAALSIQDPRERPLEAREAAARAQERFTDKRSDFMGYLNIWDAYQMERGKGASNRQMAAWCRQYFLSFLRMREWRELHAQLAQIVTEIFPGTAVFRQPERPAQLQLSETEHHDTGARFKQKHIDKKNHSRQLRAAREADYEQIHRALLTGLVAHVGMKSPEGYDYIGARGSRFHIFPASALFKARPKWIMAAELTETGKLYARDAAQIQPEWIEEEAPHLMRYHYFAPHWSRKRGEVVAGEKVTFYGLTLLTRQQVGYAEVAPQEAREIFIRGALVAQDADIQAAFFRHNQKLINEIIELENKSRKQDVLVDEEVLFAFYAQKLPETFNGRALADVRTFEAWRKTAERENGKLLFLSREELMQHAAAHITEEQFPKFWQTEDGRFPLHYRFEPNHPLDGITVSVPLTSLNRISAAALEWLVPGMIREKLQYLLKALPKQIRRLCVPVPEFITEFLAAAPDKNAPILPQLAHAVGKKAGDMRIVQDIDMDAWQAFRLPEHCYAYIRVIDDGGQELAGGRDLAALQRELGNAAEATFRDNGQEFERENLTAWDIGTLPESLKFARGRQQLTGYLGLQAEKDGSVSLRLFDTAESAQTAHRGGVIALMAHQLKEQVKDLNKGLPDFTQAAMLLKHIPAGQLRADLTAAVCSRAFIGTDALPRSEKAFKEQIKRARARLPAVKEAANAHLLEIARSFAALNAKLGRHPLTTLLRERCLKLAGAGFLQRTPWQQWARLPVYLNAMSLRLDKYSANPVRDAAREADIQELENAWQEKADALEKQGLPLPEDLAEFYWAIEEWRVSLFAQELKTPYPVSGKRLWKLWEKFR